MGSCLEICIFLSDEYVSQRSRVSIIFRKHSINNIDLAGRIGVRYLLLFQASALSDKFFHM